MFLTQWLRTDAGDIQQHFFADMLTEMRVNSHICVFKVGYIRRYYYSFDVSKKANKKVFPKVAGACKFLRRSWKKVSSFCETLFLRCEYLHE